MYLTYDEYAGMGGTLDDAVYARCAMRADALMDRMTHGRIRDESPVRDCVKYAAFDLAEAIAADMRAGTDGADIAAIGNDGVSITYATPYAPTKRYAQIVRAYLDGQVDAHGTPLMYAGVDA